MSGEFTEFDRQAMARAFTLAARGLTTTHPNPRVGCVIARDGRILGEGWHERAGEAHAEARALQAAGDVSGATVYVTLEPCSHHGRTPPCADALIAARVGRVVYSIDDPNPRVGGGGAQKMREAGIDVASGLLAAQAQEMNAGFLSRMRCGRPWVNLKLAMSLDGRTALANGASRWITGEESRADVQHWRARSSAVLTGVGTVLADDPRLDVRLPNALRQPLRVVLDSQLRTPPSARILAEPGETLLFTAVEGSAREVPLLRPGVRIERAFDGDRIDLPAVLDRLAALEINEVLIEAGPTLAGAFLRLALIDEIILYIAPVLLGPQGRALVELTELTDLRSALRFQTIEVRQIGADLRMRLKPL